MGKLDGKVAVITGGTSGMALATAKLFVEEGAYVFISGRRQKALDEAVKLIGRNVTGMQGDAANLDDLDRLFETVKREKGRIDVLFASAGRGGLRQDRRDYRRALRRSLRSEHARSALHGAKGVAAVQRWRLDHHERVDSGGQGLSHFRCLFGEQGCAALIRPHVAERAKGQEDQGKRAESGAGPNTDSGAVVRRRDDKAVRILDPAGKDGPP